MSEHGGVASSSQLDSAIPQVTPSTVKEHLMLPEGAIKLSILVAPGGAGYFTGSFVLARAEGVGEDADLDGAGEEPL